MFSGALRSSMPVLVAAAATLLGTFVSIVTFSVAIVASATSFLGIGASVGKVVRHAAVIASFAGNGAALLGAR